MKRGARLWLVAAAGASLLHTAGAPFAAPPPSAPGAAAPAGKQRIYRGTYHLRGAPAPAPRLFWYERWLEPEGSRLRSTHVHHTPGGRVVLRQSALHSADYALSSFESEQRQTGVRAEAQVLGPGRVRIQRTSGGEREQAVLEHDHPLVVGPTLYGVLLRHWDELAAGRSVVVDYLSIERLDTYAFELRRVAADARTTSFELAPKGLILSLLVSPLLIVLRKQDRQVLRYEGPSPVQIESGQELESFDARIEYSEQSAVFR